MGLLEIFRFLGDSFVVLNTAGINAIKTIDSKQKSHTRKCKRKTLQKPHQHMLFTVNFNTFAISFPTFLTIHFKIKTIYVLDCCWLLTFMKISNHTQPHVNIFSFMHAIH